MVLVTVEAMSVGSKPPVAVCVRISASGRHDFGAAASLSTKTSSQRGRAGGSTFMPKLANLSAGLDPFRRTAIPMLRLNYSSSALRESSCLLIHLPPWQDVAAKHPARGLLKSVLSLSSPPYIRSIFHPVD